ncbi:MAG TPA: flavin monoamine oxidase family protein [Thermoleophilaceae bacterium]|nr:flavin monoamine oxidase family protein [Thermoleophilaceae bacterium]
MSGSTYTRRRLIQAGAGGAAAAGLATALPAQARKRRPRHADVVVVGAGYAGLTAAHRIAAAGKSVIVMEARHRVGGRAHNHKLPGGKWSELGATFVGPTQDHVIRLAKEMDVELFDTYNTGDNVYRQDGSNQTYSDNGPLGSVFGTAPPDPLVAGDVAATVARLDLMAESVPVDAPWTAQSAEEWDSQTLYTWVKSNSTASPRFMDLLQIATEPIFGAEARDISLLYTLFYIAASGNEKNQGTFERNFNTRGGAQQQRMFGGTQAPLNRIARRLGRKHVLLHAPARRIVQKKGGGVRVESDNFNVNGKRVIVAVPPPLAGRIRYDPGLSQNRDQLTQRMPMGTLIKVEVFYDRPFWRNSGYTGQGLSDEGPISATFDISPPDGKPGILMGFIGGDRARLWQTQGPKVRRARVLDELAKLYGPAALKPKEYIEVSWVKERWTRGCPVSVLGPGTLVGFGPAIRKPVGRIHWAGTETSTYWNGYMDGAVRSGERAAREVLREI